MFDKVNSSLTETITVNSPDGSYPVYIGTHIIDRLPGWLAERGLHGQPIIVTHASLRTRYAYPLTKLLNCPVVAVPDGEAHKTLDTIRTLYDAFIVAGLDRHGVVIALGGGVIGDMAGFAAATYLRGAPFVQIPLSLLAMVDASVGGKVGVNLPQGKNLIGAFKQPEMVIVDAATLETLPIGEQHAGLAEVIKHGLIADIPDLWNPAQLIELTPVLLARAIQVKAAVVARDPYEQGERAFLNLGHTFAHAIETVSGYTWRHGEAVAVGLIAAARLSRALGLCAAELPDRIEAVVKAVGLPTGYRDYAPADLRAAMNTDKKRQDGRVRFVLIRAPGDLLLQDDVPDDLIMQIWASLKESQPL